MLKIGVVALTISIASLPLGAQVTADSYVRLESIALPPELDRVLRDYERAWAAGDEKGLADLFTEDGFVPTRFGWVRGRADILSVYKDSQGPLLLRALAFATQDTVGYIIGAYRYGEQPAGGDAGKFILALRRSPSGKWLIAADLDNSNRQ